jgi:glycosyltransferase 2 family protein
MSAKGKKSKSWKRLFNGLRLLGILLFIVILLRVDLHAIGQTLVRTNALLLVLGIFFQLVVLISKGIRWHLMNDGRSLKKRWVLSLGRFYESYAIGVVTPGRVGELLKAGHENSRNNILGTGLRVMSERGMDIGIFVALAGLSVLSAYYLELDPIYGWLIIGLAAIIMLVSLLVLTSAAFLSAINKLLSKLPVKSNDLVIDPRKYAPMATFWIVLLSVVSNLSYFVSCYYLGRAAGLDAGFIWISGAVAISGLLNMLPVTIMGLGTRELIFLYVFSAFDPNIALAFSFLVVLIAQIGGGLVSLVTGQLLLIKSRKYDYN